MHVRYTKSVRFIYFTFTEVFDEAQSYVYEIMENSVLARFLQSKDGQSYLRALVTRDNDKRQKHR